MPETDKRDMSEEEDEWVGPKPPSTESVPPAKKKKKIRGVLIIYVHKVGCLDFRMVLNTCLFWM